MTGPRENKPVCTLTKTKSVIGEANSDGEVSELATLLLGRWAGYIAKLFSLLVLLGAVIVYWVLMSNFLYHSVDYIYGKLHNSYIYSGPVGTARDNICET
jgi:hypothetical protein